MTSQPVRAICLFGTEEPTPPSRLLRAGQLTAELVDGNLRYIRFGGAEVLRAVSFLVRDKDWGTYNAKISNLEVNDEPEKFVVTLSAEASDASQSFAYTAHIEGNAQGQIRFSAQGSSATGFLTNRTGFVVLHPINGIAGAPVTITHTDGRVVASHFPQVINPVQPMSNLRKLTHTTPEGLEVETLMEGDTYEMEDQRNWTDASYKTYVRPLALPWPYRLGASDIIDQSVTVSIRGTVPVATATASAHLTAGRSLGVVPPLGMGLRPEDVAAALGHTDQLKAIAAVHLIIHHDPRQGHNEASLRAQLEVAQMLNAEAWLEAVIVATDTKAASAEVARLGIIAKAMGGPFTTVLVSPAPDLKCTLPGSVWPPAPDAVQLYAATRAAFPRARIGGGMFSYFTELNRKRPPNGGFDLISFTTSPLVHAGDDQSVMESLEANSAIIESVSFIAGKTPWAVGPSAIGMRDNPYGAAPKKNPANIRQAMNWNDPRQRGLLGAVWNLGYFVDFAGGGADAVTLGGLVGPFGVLHTAADYPQPGYDKVGGLFPVFHILRGLARLCGGTMRELDFAPNSGLTGCAAEKDGRLEFWIGNRTPEPLSISLDPNMATKLDVAVLDAKCFGAASNDHAFMDRMVPAKETLHLDSYAVVRVVENLRQ